MALGAPPLVHRQQTAIQRRCRGAGAALPRQGAVIDTDALAGVGQGAVDVILPGRSPLRQRFAALQAPVFFAEARRRP